MQLQQRQPSHPRGSVAGEMAYFAAVHCGYDATPHELAAVDAAAAAVVAVGFGVAGSAAVAVDA